jgi:YD repeat-containing protein
VTTINYDATTGLPEKVTHPNTAVDSVEYNSNGLPTKIIPQGLTATQIWYNSTWAAQRDSTKQSGAPTYVFYVGTNGRVDSTKTGTSAYRVRYTYYSKGRVTQIKDHDLNIIGTRVYNGTNGNLSKVTNPQTTHTFGYDAYGRATSDSLHGVVRRVTTFNTMNWVTDIDDGVNTNPTEFTYDAMGQPTDIEDPTINSTSSAMTRWGAWNGARTPTTRKSALATITWAISWCR